MALLYPVWLYLALKQTVMPNDSAITLADRANFQIERFIFHIIIEDDELPTFLESVEITPSQIEFFKERFVEASEGTQYVFAEREHSNFYNNCCELVANDGQNFLRLSKTLTQDFKTHHIGTVNDGVFVVAIVNTGDENKLVFLIKMDHSKVLRYILQNTPEGRRATMEEVFNSIVEDKKAMQKVAIVDLGERYSWDVLAKDRNKTTGIADFFLNFMNVIERETSSQLTIRAVASARQWAVAAKEQFPELPEASVIKHRAIQYMDTHTIYDNDSFMDMVLVNQDENRDQDRELEKRNSFNNFLIEKGVAGQSFEPKPNSISRKEKENIRRTREGVEIKWEGEPSANGINIEEPGLNTNQLYNINIKTSRLSTVK